jgi:hypothetical protein
MLDFCTTNFECLENLILVIKAISKELPEILYKAVKGN